MRTKLKGDNVSHDFEGVSDFLSYIQKPTTMRDNARSSITGTERFTGTHTYDEAIDLARRGWTGGTAAIEKLRAEIERSLIGQIPVPERQYSMTKGKRVSVDRYTAGRPDCLIHRVDKGKRRDSQLPKIVHLVVNVSASQGVTGAPLLMRGAAAIVLVDVLAKYRIRCAIDLVSTWSTSVMNPDAPKLEFKLPLKGDNDPVNISRLAFFLGHPSSIRRLIFSAMEHEEEGNRSIWGIGRDHGGYGIPATAEYKGDIYIDRIRTSRDWSEGFAIEWLKHQLDAQGIALKEI